MNTDQILKSLPNLDAQNWIQIREKIDALIGGNGGLFYWLLYGLLGMMPAVLAVVYFHRRLGTRRTLLLQTILSMDLCSTYMRMRHGTFLAEWAKTTDDKKKLADFETKYFNEDFHAGTSRTDYAFPVLLFTSFSLLGWLVALHHVAPIVSVLRFPEVPDAWILGFVGAYFACLLTMFDEFRQYNLEPSVYYSVSYRLGFNSIAAYLATLASSAAFSPLVAFGVGIFPLQQAWDFITDRTAKGLGSAGSKAPPGEELKKIQGLEEDHNRKKLVDIGIHSIQSLATADPLLIFFQTTLPLRTVVDLMDKAILFSYVGEKVTLLRSHGINGVIELMLIGHAAEKLAANVDRVQRTPNDLFDQLDRNKLVSDISTVIGQTTEELRNFIFQLCHDPLVCFIADIWSRTLPRSDVVGSFPSAASDLTSTEVTTIREVINPLMGTSH